MMVLNRPEKMLFALLRGALGTQTAATELFAGASAEAWQACFRLAVKQGVTALAWDGVLQLSSDLQPPKALKLSWGMTVEKHEARYERYCCVAAELCDYYTRYDIAMVQLKGVGLSTYYPVPCHREGGDIDIYTYSAAPDKLTDPEANRLADDLMMRQGIDVDYHSYKHSFFYYKGIPVENHKMFLNIKDYRAAVESDTLLHRLLKPETVQLCGKYRIQVPSPAFNALFLAFHAAQHYGCGLALHHLCDWTCLLQRYGLLIPDGLTDPNIRRWMLVLTKLCNDHLGTQIVLPEACDEPLADEVLDEVLHPFGGKPVPKGKVGIILYKIRRMIYLNRLRRKVLPLSLARRVWGSILFHLRYPQTVFVTGK